MNTAMVITFFRLVVAPIFLFLLIYFHRTGHPVYFYLSMVVWLLLGLSDAADGYIARKFKQETRLGMMLDPLADKILMVSAYIAFAEYGYIPIYLAFLVVSRDVLILIFGLFNFLFHNYVGKPAYISKLNTGLQVALILIVMITIKFTVPGILFLKVLLIHIVTATTFLSGLVYLINFFKNLKIYNNGIRN